MKERIVFEVCVQSKNIISDGLQWARNVLGKRLPAYENMITKGIQTALDRLYCKYPNVRNVRFSTSQVTKGAAEIIVYGVVDE